MILENWRYSNTQKISDYVAEANSVAAPAADVAWGKSVVKNYTGVDSVLVFSNGKLNTELSRLGELTCQNLPVSKNIEEHAVYDFNSARAAGRHQLQFNKEKNPSVFLIHLLESSASASQISLDVSAGANVEVTEIYVGKTPAKSFSGNRTDILLGKKSQIKYNLLAFLESSNRLSHFLNLEQAEGSSAKLFNASLGGEWCRYDVRAALKASGAAVNAGGLYLVSGSESVDHCTKIIHAAPETQSEQLYKGILGGSSRAIFNGVIHIDKNCPNSKANQLNRNLLVSKRAEAISRPQLEILTDNVKANHGMTIGNLNPDEVFYLQSRGLDSATANEILADAFLNEVVENYVNPTANKILREKLQSYWAPLRESII